MSASVKVLAVMVVAFGSAATAAAQPNFDQALNFQSRTIQPANRALDAADLTTARRLVTTTIAEFQRLEPVFQVGQVSTLQRLARRYLDRGLPAEAAQLLQACVGVLDAAGQLGTGFLPPVLADLARSYRLSGQSILAEPLLNRAQAIRPYRSPNDIDSYPVIAELAELRRERGDLAAADDLIRPIVTASERLQGWQYIPNLIPVFELYATIREQRGEVAAARQFRAKSVTITENIEGAERQLQNFRPQR